MSRLVSVFVCLTVYGSASARTAAPSVALPNLVSFDCDRVEIVWADHHWQLKAGNIVLKDFGRRDAEARQAVRLIQSLRLNQYGTIGSPNPVVEYWLSDGRAPSGHISGMRNLAFDPTTLKVENSAGQWCLSEGTHVLFKFGHRGEEARQALAVIEQYGFTHVAIVGQATPSMMIFLGGVTETPFARSHHQVASHDPAKKENDDKSKTVQLKSTFGNGVLATPAIPALRSAANGSSGPRTAFADGQLRLLPSGRQLGAKATAPDVTELADRIAFDWKQVQARRDDTGWILAAGGHVLARFGDKEHEARKALDLVSRLHLTEQLAVGRPVCFSYFLVNGQPPRGVPLGLDARAFQPDSLTIRPIGNLYALCDQTEPLLFFGSSATEAKKFLEVIRKERFDRICQLGVSREEGMTLLMRGR